MVRFNFAHCCTPCQMNLLLLSYTQIWVEILVRAGDALSNLLFLLGNLCKKLS